MNRKQNSITKYALILLDFLDIIFSDKSDMIPVIGSDAKKRDELFEYYGI